MLCLDEMFCCRSSSLHKAIATIPFSQAMSLERHDFPLHEASEALSALGAPTPLFLFNDSRVH